MAIFKGIISKMSGSIGNLTFRRVADQTIVSEKVERKATPVRTRRQMIRRMQWDNVVALYRAFDGKLHPSFENKSPRVSDFNEFVSANVGVVPVYLEKDEARQGACVVPSYQVTRGSLPSIVVSGSAARKTDIALGSTFAISASTTLKQFSDAVVAANPGRFANGDEITCFIALQKSNAATGVPFVTIKAEQVTLDQADSATLLRSVVGADGFSAADGFLGASAAVSGAICWVHSRRTASGTKVSTQRFEVSNPLLAAYQAASKLEAAILSYGGINKEDYLTPDIDDYEDIEGFDPDNGGNSPSPSPQQRPRVTLELRAATPGTVTFTVDGEAYEEPLELEAGTTVGIHAEPKEGFAFTKWRGDGTTDPDREVKVDDDMTLVAETEEA